MPNFSRASTCVSAIGNTSYKNITIAAFQYKNNGVSELNWNDPSQYITADHTGANSTAYTGSVLPTIAQPVSNSFPYYANANNPGMLFSSSSGRTWSGAFSDSQPSSINYSLNDYKMLVLMSDAANKTFTYAVTNGTQTSTFTGNIATPNIPTVFIFRPNSISTQSGSAKAQGGTVAGTALASTATKETFSSTTAGGITMFNTYATGVQSNFPGSVYSTKICCLEEITTTNEVETTDILCGGVVKQQLITKQTKKTTIKVTEMDLQTLLVFTGAIPVFESNSLSKQISAGTTPTGTGNVNYSVGPNKQITKVEVGGEVLSLVRSTANLDFNQCVYDEVAGNIVMSGSKYGGKEIIVYGASTDTRLVTKIPTKTAGYNVHVEMPREMSNGEIRTVQFVGQISTFTQENVADNATSYTVEILELPDNQGNYNTIFG